MPYRFALLLSLFPAVALAQVPAPPPPPAPAPTVAPAPKPATVKVALETSLGTITIEVETERAPVTASNFLRYVDQKRLDGTSFYRADPVAANFGLIQGGTRN